MVDFTIEVTKDHWIIIPQWIISAQSDNNEREHWRFSNLHSCLCLAVVSFPEPWHSPKPCSKGSQPALDVSLQSLKQQCKQHGETLAGTILFPLPTLLLYLPSHQEQDPPMNLLLLRAVRKSVFFSFHCCIMLHIQGQFWSIEQIVYGKTMVTVKIKANMTMLKCISYLNLCW